MVNGFLRMEQYREENREINYKAKRTRTPEGLHPSSQSEGGFRRARKLQGTRNDNPKLSSQSRGSYSGVE